MHVQLIRLNTFIHILMPPREQSILNLHPTIRCHRCCEAIEDSSVDSDYLQPQHQVMLKRLHRRHAK